MIATSCLTRNLGRKAWLSEGFVGAHDVSALSNMLVRCLTAQATSSDIASKVEEAERTEQEFDAAREQYHSVFCALIVVPSVHGEWYWPPAMALPASLKVLSTQAGDCHCPSLTCMPWKVCLLDITDQCFDIAGY